MDIESIFNRVVFDAEDRAYHFELYNKVKELANDINERCPDSAEKTLAMRAFHMGLMHVGAALAKHEKYLVASQVKEPDYEAQRGISVPVDMDRSKD